MDLYGTNNAAISMGNARREQVRDLNERIQQHNVDIANQISGLKDQVKTTESIKQAQDTAKALWTGSKMPDKIKAYKDYKAAQSAKANPEANAEATQTAAVESARPTVGETTAPAVESVEEGGLGRSVTQAGESAAGDIAESLSNAGAKDVGSAIATASKSGAGEVAESLGSKVAGGLGKAAGGAFGAAMSGLDVYEDIKSKSIAGNNNWEKAGNLLQIGGGIADVAGMAFPPLALLGGVLDLASGATEAVGEKLDAEKSASDLSKTQQQETEKPDTEVIQQATLTTGRVD
jgi:hypothetical protein